MYKYYLTYNAVKTEIEKEPIGWDDFSVSLKRNEKSHGISAEFSEMSLRFWCYTSMVILRAAYNTDIDSIVTFSVEKDGVQEYSGQVDFADYQNGFDKYNYIALKVSEIGIQTTFNNRIEQKVNIDSLTAFDGAILPVYSNLNKVINLPAKAILMTSRSQNNNIYTQDIGEVTGNKDALIKGLFRIDLAFADNVYVELNDYFGIGDSLLINPVVGGNMYVNALPIFTQAAVEDGISISGGYTVKFKFKGSVKLTYGNPIIQGVVLLHKGASREIVYQSTVVQSAANTNEIFFDVENIVQIQSLDTLFFCIQFLLINDNWAHRVTLNMDSGNYFEIKALSIVPDTTSRLSFVHETMSRIAESISNNQLKVKSDYYGRSDSNINPAIANGYGSLKAISTGLRIRNALMSDGAIPALTLSFADIIKGLTPIDNIGYGLEKNGGALDLRVEKWDYFYKSDVVLEISNPSKITRSLNPTDIISRFKVGYKKYTSGDTNSIDGFHSDREYRTRIKLVETLLDQLSEFISDSYAIEYTRRLALKKDTKDWQYDADIFLFVLKGIYRIYVTDPASNGSRYEIDLGVTDSGNTIISSTTVYNARISPARIAMNWLNKIFSFKKAASENLTYTSGTGNVTASFKPVITLSVPGVDPVKGNYTDNLTYHGSNNSVLNENGNFQSGSVILKPETLTISEYPLTKSEYEIIKNNPYGTIIVDGEPCYLKSLNYKFKTGIASFTLIPKFE